MNREVAVSFYIPYSKQDSSVGHDRRSIRHCTVSERVRERETERPGILRRTMQFVQLSDGRVVVTNDMWDHSNFGGDGFESAIPRWGACWTHPENSRLPYQVQGSSGCIDGIG